MAGDPLLPGLHRRSGRRIAGSETPNVLSKDGPRGHRRIRGEAVGEDGRFYSNYTVHVRGPKGKLPKLKTVYGKTAAECERNLIRALADRDDGVLLDTHNPQLADYLPWWLERIVADTVKQTTWDGYAKMGRTGTLPPRSDTSG